MPAGRTEYIIYSLLYLAKPLDIIPTMTEENSFSLFLSGEGIANARWEIRDHRAGE